MNFTEEHIPILDQHKHHWIGLRDLQVMKNLDRPVINDLQRIYNEAIGPRRFTPWCSECVSDLVRLLYTQYEKWEEQQPGESAGEITDPEGAEKPKGKPGRKPKEKADGN